MCVPFLIFYFFSSVNGQTRNSSSVSALFNTEEYATTDVSNQQQNQALISLEEKRKIRLARDVLSILILFFGTFGNVMTIVIHKRTLLTSSLSFYFIILAVSDLGLLYTNCFRDLIVLLFDFNIARQSSLFCKVDTFIVYVSSVMSPWTLVAMTVQRAVCVLWPHRAHILCSVRKPKSLCCHWCFS